MKTCVVLLQRTLSLSIPKCHVNMDVSKTGMKKRDNLKLMIFRTSIEPAIFLVTVFNPRGLLCAMRLIGRKTTTSHVISSYCIGQLS